MKVKTRDSGDSISSNRARANQMTLRMGCGLSNVISVFNPFEGHLEHFSTYINLLQLQLMPRFKSQPRCAGTVTSVLLHLEACHQVMLLVSAERALELPILVDQNKASILPYCGL